MAVLETLLGSLLPQLARPSLWITAIYRPGRLVRAAAAHDDLLAGGRNYGIAHAENVGIENSMPTERASPAVRQDSGRQTWCLN
jgi:hypothetical protein